MDAYWPTSEKILFIQKHPETPEKPGFDNRMAGDVRLYLFLMRQAKGR